MSDENPVSGILSEEDAVNLFLTEPEATPEEEDQAPQDGEVDQEDEADEEPSGDFEAEDVDGDGEADEVDEETADGDNSEEIDPDELEKGYLRQADYSRKTADLAREREALAAEKQQQEAQWQHKLATLEKAVQHFSIPTEQEPDWVAEAEKLDPKALQIKRAQWDQKKAKAAEAQRVHAALTQQQQAEVVSRETEALLDKLPEWRDPKMQSKEVESIISFAADYGFTAEDIGGIADHRQLVLLRDLMIAKRAASAVKQKKAKAPAKVTTAKAPVRAKDEDSAAKKARARLKKTGSVEDAVNSILG